jgi:Domain of unknown function (DUF4384)
MRGLALAGLAACAGTAPVPPAPAAPREPRGAQVGFEVVRRSGVPVNAHDSVPTNTDFAITVTLASPAHVYVGGLNAAHKAYLLLPEPNASAELPAGRHRIPAAGKWLFLEPPRGPETLFVIASQRLLGDVDLSLAHAVGELPPPESAEPGVLTVPPPSLFAEASAPAAPAPAASAARPKAGLQAAHSERRVGPRRRDRDWQPNANEIGGLRKRGALIPRRIGIRDEGAILVPDRNGIVVFLLPFVQVAAEPEGAHPSSP